MRIISYLRLVKNIMKSTKEVIKTLFFFFFFFFLNKTNKKWPQLKHIKGINSTRKLGREMKEYNEQCLV